MSGSDLQKIGPLGSEIDLRQLPYVVEPPTTPFVPHDDQIIIPIPGSDVLLARDDQSYFDFSAPLIIRAAPGAVRTAARAAITNMLYQAGLFTVNVGQIGTAAFYEEWWGDDPAMDVWPVVGGRLVERSREGWHAYLEMELKLILRAKL